MFVHGYSDNEFEADDDQPTLISKLDLSSPLHLHPNDSTILTVVSVKLKVLVGLDNCYMQIRSNILSRVELPDVKRASSIISSEQSHRVVFSSSFGNSYRSQSTVFNCNVGNKNNAQRPQASVSNSRPANVTRPVNNWNRRPNRGGLPWKRNNNNSNNQGVQNFNKRFINNNNYVASSSNSLSDDQISKLITLIKENSLNSTSKGVQPNMAGANQHLTHTDKNLVNVIDISYLCITVSQPNGTETCITKVGNMVLKKFLTLHDVLDLRDLKVLGTGRQIDGFYYFNEGLVAKKDLSTSLLLLMTILGLFGCICLNPRMRLPSSVLSGESPYKLVFNKKPNLNHLRTFGYLCYATILTNSDKFSSSQDLNHSNLFDNLDVEIPNTPCDKERVVNIPNSDGSNSSQVGSPTIDQNENIEIQFSASNGSATGSEMAITREDNHNNSEGDDGNVQNIETGQITQPVRRIERSSVFPNNYNDFVVDPKVKYGLEKKSIGGKWVYKIKYKFSGKVKRYNARYVVKGYNQKEGVDFDETFSPVVKSDLPEGFFNPDDKRAKCLATRKSVTGFCVKVNGSLVSWKSKKQHTLAKSSTEVEYRAMAFVTYEVIMETRGRKKSVVEPAPPARDPRDVEMIKRLQQGIQELEF
nr:hypothetical protein [Tanacetum cinerariifolium]